MKKSDRVSQTLLRHMGRDIIAPTRRIKYSRVRPGSQLLQQRSMLLPRHH